MLREDDEGINLFANKAKIGKHKNDYYWNKARWVKKTRPQK